MKLIPAKLNPLLIGLAALLLLGVIVLASAFSFPAVADQDDLSSFGGEGKRNMNPPAVHTVTEGETMYDIARLHSVPYLDLVIENRLSGEPPLLPGTKLLLPRYPENGRDETKKIDTITIRAECENNTAPARVLFSADVTLNGPGRRFVWELGNNRFRFEEAPVVLYTHPCVYQARLAVVAENGRYTLSNTLTVRVSDIAAEYQGLPYLTLERVGDLLSVRERARDEQGEPVVFDAATVIQQDPPLLKKFSADTFQATAGGFSRIRLSKGTHAFEFYLFVSPFPARLSVEPEFDWYKTQFETGMYGNCGPAANASAVKWAVGKDLTVERVRDEIGMPYENGAVDYNNLRENLLDHGVPSSLRKITSANDVTEVIDAGGIAIVSFNCGVLNKTAGDTVTDFVGRYYPDATGHYLLIKGYTLDRRYFIVYDAIPGDWAENRLRYRDGVSQIGRNRFFSIDEVMSSIKGSDMIVVFRENGS